VASHRSVCQQPDRGRSRSPQGAIAANARTQARPQRQRDHRRACVWCKTFGVDTTSWLPRSPPTGDWRSHSTNWSWRSDPSRGWPSACPESAQRNSASQSNTGTSCSPGRLRPANTYSWSEGVGNFGVLPRSGSTLCRCSSISPTQTARNATTHQPPPRPWAPRRSARPARQWPPPRPRPQSPRWSAC
jgi:hypothetical protein